MIDLVTDPERLSTKLKVQSSKHPRTRHYAAGSSEVQPEHLVAARGIADKQYGQSLVVAASAFFRLLTAFTIRKITKATIRKPIMSLMNAP